MWGVIPPFNLLIFHALHKILLLLKIEREGWGQGLNLSCLTIVILLLDLDPCEGQSQVFSI